MSKTTSRLVGLTKLLLFLAIATPLFFLAYNYVVSEIEKNNVVKEHAEEALIETRAMIQLGSSIGTKEVIWKLGEDEPIDGRELKFDFGGRSTFGIARWFREEQNLPVGATITIYTKDERWYLDADKKFLLYDSAGGVHHGPWKGYKDIPVHGKMVVKNLEPNNTIKFAGLQQNVGVLE